MNGTLWYLEADLTFRGGRNGRTLGGGGGDFEVFVGTMGLQSIVRYPSPRKFILRPMLVPLVEGRTFFWVERIVAPANICTLWRSASTNRRLCLPTQTPSSSRRHTRHLAHSRNSRGLLPWVPLYLCFRGTV